MLMINVDPDQLASSWIYTFFQKRIWNLDKKVMHAVHLLGLNMVA